MLVACNNRNDVDKQAIAEGILSKHVSEIINTNYGGGENAVYEIISLQSNTYDDFDARVRINFKGQYTGIEYWAIGELHIDLSTKKYQYTSIERSQALINAMQIENKLKEKGLEVLNNALQDSGDYNEDNSTLPADTSTYSN